MSTINAEQQQRISDYLATHTLPKGLGNKEAACSIAAINLALTGELTDKIPECMSRVLGRWIIRVQDAMPHDIRNSAEWKRLLPLAAGTGREKENERKDIILDWMWRVVLPYLLPLAEKRGFGDAWRAMCEQKTRESALLAKKAADAAYAYAVAAADAVADAADAAYAADAADAYAVAAAAYVADAAAAKRENIAAAAVAVAAAVAAAAYAEVAAAAYVADAAATYVADAADAAAVYADAYAWAHFDPCALLRKLIEV